MNTKLKSAGYTLVELIIYLGLVAVFLVVATKFTQDITYGRVKTDVQQEVTSNLQMVSIQLEKTVRQAIGINLESDFDTNLATTPGVTLSLQMSEEKNPAIFSVSAGTLYLQQGFTNPYALTSNLVEVTNLTFFNRSSENQKSKNIKYILAVRFKTSSADVAWYSEQTIQGTIELRNNPKTQP